MCGGTEKARHQPPPVVVGAANGLNDLVREGIDASSVVAGDDLSRRCTSIRRDDGYISEDSTVRYIYFIYKGVG
jgi:hypothetical protein